MAQRCEHCNMNVAGEADSCPLCQSKLRGTPDPQSAVFPAISPKEWKKQALALKICLFVSFALVVICITIDALLPKSYSWPWYVAAAVLCVWVCIVNALIRRHNIPKNILWLVFWISMLSVLWDWFTGWKGWSVDYVIPALCMTAVVAIMIVSKAMKRRLKEYLVYLIIGSLFGVMPLWFWSLGWVRIRYPSILCSSFCILALGALLFFKSGELFEEVRKRLHL